MIESMMKRARDHNHRPNLYMRLGLKSSPWCSLYHVTTVDLGIPSRRGAPRNPQSRMWCSVGKRRNGTLVTPAHSRTPKATNIEKRNSSRIKISLPRGSKLVEQNMRLTNDKHAYEFRKSTGRSFAQDEDLWKSWSPSGPHMEDSHAGR